MDRDLWEFDMTVKLLLAAGALLASTSAWAQPAPKEQTPDDLVCQLTGDCGGIAAIKPTEESPDSRGFKLARRTTSSEPSTPSAVVSAKSGAKVAAEPSRPGLTASKPGRNRTIAKAPLKAAPGRADLRVSFVTGSAELTEAGRREADKFITALSAPALGGKKFRIEGHTDSVGSRQFNVELSKRRAQAVVDYLAAKGADRSRFAVVGYGPDKPIAGLDAGAGANRRVEVVLVK